MDYLTVDGEEIAASVDTAWHDFLSDAVGTVACTVSQSVDITSRFRAKPFGQPLLQEGESASSWIKSLGYRSLHLADPSHYVRARHYSAVAATWTSCDPIFPTAKPYAYTPSPATQADPTGLYPTYVGCEKDKAERLGACCHKFAPTSLDSKKVKACMRRSPFGMRSFDDADVDWFLELLQGLCSKAGKQNSVCVRCADENGLSPSWTCPKHPCRDIAGLWGIAMPDAVVPAPPTGPDRVRCDLDTILDEDCSGARIDANGGTCSCGIIICDVAFYDPRQNLCAIYFHELSHCSGLGHKGGHELPQGVHMDRYLDFVYKLGCCACMAALGDDNCGTECERLKPR